MANINLDNPKGTLEKRDLFVLSVWLTVIQIEIAAVKYLFCLVYQRLVKQPQDIQTLLPIKHSLHGLNWVNLLFLIKTALQNTRCFVHYWNL